MNYQEFEILKFVKDFIDNCMDVWHKRAWFMKAAAVLFIENFVRSLGDNAAKLDREHGYGEHMFLAQVEYFQNYEPCDEETRRGVLYLTVNFYRELVKRYPDEKYFEDAYWVPERLLFSPKMTSWITERISFTPYSSTMSYPKGDKTIIVLHGFDQWYTRFSPQDFLLMDMTPIASRFFRKLYFDYLRSSRHVFSECATNNPKVFARFLNAMLEVKKRGGTQEDHWTVMEARLTKELIDNATVISACVPGRIGEPLSIPYKNMRIGFFKRWFTWAVLEGRLSVEDTFFDEWVQIEEPSKNEAKPIPHEDLEKMMAVAKAKSKDKELYRLYYIAICINLIMSIRPSDVLSLKVSGLRESISQTNTVLHHITKTSKGRLQKDPLTKNDLMLINEAVALTAPLREKANKALKDHIFLYTTNRGSIDQIKVDALSDFMQRCCNEAGIKTYSPYRLRYTFYTALYESKAGNELTDNEKKILSKHMKIGTTMGYVKRSRAEYFRAVFHVMGDNKDAVVAGQVVETMPKGTQDIGVRGDGLGKCCSPNGCLDQSMLPCIACRHFITTVEHEPFFKRMIEIYDKEMESAASDHEREDILTKKELMVSYLIEIDKVKQKSK